MATGRPSLYTPLLAERICSRIAGGLSLRRVCRTPGMPDKATVLRWIGQHSAFRDQYARACEARGMLQGEEVNEIAERALAGEIPPDVARVAIDAKKWCAARMAPKVYGDRVALTDPNGDPLGTSAAQARIEMERKLARLDGPGAALALSDQSH